MDFGNLYNGEDRPGKKHVVDSEVLNHNFMQNIKTIAFSEDSNNAFGINAVD